MSSHWPALLNTLGRGEPVSGSAVGGGCIANARIAVFADGSEVFVKSAEAPGDMFRREAEGLQALATADAIRVPTVLAVDDAALVLEKIIPAPRSSDFSSTFGRRLARLHRHQAPACGFAHDNYIGLTPQPNTPVNGEWCDQRAEGPQEPDGSDWPDFYIQRRLHFQAELAVRNAHGNELAMLLTRAEPRIRVLLGQAIEPPGLLHGDLWGGNYMVDESGQACLIDPAVYYGHREAELAMTRLFGGFDREFYAAYEAEWPLQRGHVERLPLYQLYHLLNHLNLFGRSYYPQCERILRSLC